MAMDDDFGDDPYGDDIIADYADNPAPRLPCVLIVDGSGSMAGEPIKQLNEGLKKFAEEIKSDAQAAVSARIKIIRVGGERPDVLTDWTDAIDFTAPTVVAGGGTPLGAGIALAMQEIDAEKRRLDAADILRKRAWLFVLTDGQPTDGNWKAQAAACKQAELEGKVSVFPIGVDGANMTELAELTDKREPRHISNGNFSQFFLWLSKSISAGSRAVVDEAETPASGLPSSNQQTPVADNWLGIYD